MATRPVSIRLAESFILALESRAEEQLTSKAELLRQCIKTGFQDTQNETLLLRINAQVANLQKNQVCILQILNELQARK